MDTLSKRRLSFPGKQSNQDMVCGPDPAVGHPDTSKRGTGLGVCGGKKQIPWLLLEPIHVVLVSTYSPLAVGGIGQFVHDLSIELFRRGVTVTAIYRYEEPEFAVSEALSRSAQLVELRARNFKGLRTLSLGRRTAKWVRRNCNDIDVLHVLNPMPMAASALREGHRHRIPSVVTIYAKYPRSINPLLQWINRRAETTLLTENDFLVYESASTMRAFAGHPGRVILNGIDTTFFRPDPDLKDRMRRSLGIGPDEAVILFLGRMDRLKGIYTFLDGLRILQTRTASFRALLVGSIEVPDLAQRIRELGLTKKSVTIGPVGKLDVRDFYCAADVFVLPSYLEGISSSLIEAMSCGLPAIATSVGGNPEVVRDGVEGLLIPPGDSNSLAEALETLTGNGGLRNLLGVAARARIVEKFSLKAMTDEYVSLYSAAKSK